MAKVRLGPFSEMHFTKLKEKLDQAQIPFEKSEDGELLKVYLEKMQIQAHGRYPSHPVYSGILPEHIFIELEKSGLLVIKEELDNLGQPPVERPQPQDVDEYFCPQCDFHSDHGGQCPKHGISLLNYSDWVSNKSKPTLVGRIILLVLLALGISVIVYILSISLKDNVPGHPH